MSIKQEFIAIFESAYKKNGCSLDPEVQAENIIAAGETDKKFHGVLNSNRSDVKAALFSQVRYIAGLGVSTSKAAEMCYIKTTNINVAPYGQKKDYVTFPDITESYKALISVLVNSGVMKRVDVHHCYENTMSHIDWDGNMTRMPRFTDFMVPASERGKYRGVFVILTLPDGSYNVTWRDRADTDQYQRKYSRNSFDDQGNLKDGSVWAKHPLKMYAKSAIWEALDLMKGQNNIIDSILESAASQHDYDANPGEMMDAVERITEDQCGEVRSLLESNGMNENQFNAFLVKKFKVSSIEKITPAIMQDVINSIEAVAKRKAKKQGQGESA